MKETINFVYDLILNQMSQSIIITDFLGNIIDWLGSSEKMFGYKSNEIIGNNISVLYPPETRFEEIERVLKSIEKTGVFEYETIALRKDKTVFFIKSRISIVYDSEGKPLFLTGINTDITDKIKNEKKINEINEQFKKAVEKAPFGFTIREFDGTILYINKKTEELFKIKRENVVNKERTLAYYVDKEEFIKYSTIVKTEGFINNYELKMKDVNEKQFWVSISSNIIEFDGKHVYASAFYDITEKKQNEELLKNNKEYLQTIFDSLNEAIFIHDIVNSDIIDVNKTACDMYGYTKEELLQLNIGDISSGTENFNQEHAIDKLNNAKEGKPQVFEWIAKRKNGELFQVEVNITFAKIFNEERFFVAVRDISERKLFETKIIESQKMDSIGNLAAGIAHDFNNMLGGILGYSTLLINEEQNSIKRKYIEGIINSSKRATELTQKLLTFGKRGMNIIKAVNINDIINDVCGIVERTITQNITIEKSLCTNLNTIDGDIAQINQVVMNLLVNSKDAIDYHGKITIQTQNVIYNNKEFVLLKISDTGHGIEESIKNKIFEPFFTTKKEGKIKGMGLGLSVVYGVVNAHNGFINVESEINKGTSFYVYFPKGIKEKEESNSLSNNVLQKGKGIILLIEDEEIIREMTKTILTKLGYFVLTAQNGFDGCNIYKEKYNEINVVIIDMQMPVMNGKETFIKMKEINNNIKAILSTGYNKTSEVEDIIKAGVKKFLQKPYTINEISQVIQETLMN